MSTSKIWLTMMVIGVIAILCLALLAAAPLMLNGINAPSSIHGGIMIIHTTSPIV